MTIINGFSKFSITTDIRNLLLQNEELASLVGTNIFPVIAPEETAGDFIIYYRDQYSKEYAGDIITLEACKIFFAIVSEDYDRSIQITELVNKIIEGTHYNTDNYMYKCLLKDSTEDYQDKKYIQILLFEVI
jgi:hypothetical protein